MNKTNDFGRDSIPLLVLKISIPFMIAQFVNVFYSIVEQDLCGEHPGHWSRRSLPGWGFARAHRDAAVIVRRSFWDWRFGPFSPCGWELGDEKGARRFLANSFSLMIIVSNRADRAVPIVKGPAPELVRRE